MQIEIDWHDSRQQPSCFVAHYISLSVNENRHLSSCEQRWLGPQPAKLAAATPRLCAWWRPRHVMALHQWKIQLLLNYPVTTPQMSQ